MAFSITTNRAQKADALGEDTGVEREEAAINRVVARYVETWNSHDMDAWGQLFTEDVDYVNRAGGWWRGNDANVENHKLIHAELAKHNTTYSASVSKIRFLTPEIALVHATWTMAGLAPKQGDTSGEFKGILSMVMIKRSEAWLIRAAQNTVTTDLTSDSS